MIELAMHPTHGFRIVTARGIVTAYEFMTTWRDIVGHRDFDPALDWLIDLSDVKELDFGYPTVSAVDATLRRIDATGVQQRTAIVAPSDALYGMSRMFANVRLSGFQKIEVFRELAPSPRVAGPGACARRHAGLRKLIRSRAGQGHRPAL